jgi:ElaB/YqjD/DUF883 family membrane-anchored ribosome-binding protein
MDEATDKISTADRFTDDYEDPEQLRADIEDTRAEMSQTINEIQERLSPENVMDQVKEKVREATIGKVERVMNKVGETMGEVTEPAREVVMETGKSAVDVVWRNPIPVALIGLGLGMIAMRAFRRGNGYDYDETRSSRSRMQRQSLTGTETPYGRHETEHTGTVNRVKETATDLAHRSTDALNNLGTKAMDTASSVSTRVEHMLRENPLAVGAVAVAAGTAVGLMLPATRFESEYIGETGEKLVDKAQEVAREAIDKVQNVAEQQMAPGQQQPGP